MKGKEFGSSKNSGRVALLVPQPGLETPARGCACERIASPAVGAGVGGASTAVPSACCLHSGLVLLCRVSPLVSPRAPLENWGTSSCPGRFAALPSQHFISGAPRGCIGFPPAALPAGQRVRDVEPCFLPRRRPRSKEALPHPAVENEAGGRPFFTWSERSFGCCRGSLAPLGAVRRTPSDRTSAPFHSSSSSPPSLVALSWLFASL